jgi:hypothetical protein
MDAVKQGELFRVWIRASGGGGGIETLQQFLVIPHIVEIHGDCDDFEQLLVGENQYIILGGNVPITGYNDDEEHDIGNTDTQ